MKMAEQDALEREDKVLTINTYGGEFKINNNIPELCYSGGKDSDVILRLAQLAGIKYNAIYKNTTIDPSGTIRHAKENGVIVAKPKDHFFGIIEKKGMPSRLARYCCELLKEYKFSDVQIMGIRTEESRKRSERYKEPNLCRIYSKNEKSNVWLPIREWTSEDVSEFVKSEKIQCHSLYYDECGNFHPERRLGCIGCPISTRKKRLSELKKYPLFVREYAKRLKIYRESRIRKFTEKQITQDDFPITFKVTHDEYEHLYLLLFCDSINDFQNKMEGFFGRMDCKAFLEDYFQIKFK